MVRQRKGLVGAESIDSVEYRAHWVDLGENGWDIQIEKHNRTWSLSGGQGGQRERKLLQRLESEALPVFLGSGLGAAIEDFLLHIQGPLAVVDKESKLLQLTGCKQKFAGQEDLLWLEDSDPEQVLRQLTQWQMQHGGKKLVPVALPIYQRLDRDYYYHLYSRLNASRRFSFWSKTRYEKFRDWPPRILLLTSKYFLMGEIQAALKRMGVPFQLITLGDDELGCEEFVQTLLQGVLEFQPDFVLTVNHLGIDREGVLIELLQQMRLPLASWFVDNPHLILYLYNKVISPWTMVFTWDADTQQSVKDLGFEHVRYLPLATDTHRFRPGLRGKELWQSDVSFLGNSMVFKVEARMKAGAFPAVLLRGYKKVARHFGESVYASVSSFLADNYPHLFQVFIKLPTIEKKLAYETMLTWEATRQYRLHCVQNVLDFNPLIVGDRGWKILLPKEQRSWRWHPELNYYDQVPAFYPQSAINFNCTSQQMKGAVNQRVFDVPASGSFLLTDYRSQIESLFEVDSEVICYRELEEIKDLVRFYLRHPEKRAAIVQAARKRVLEEHTYEKRLEELMQAMYTGFAGNC